MPNKKKTNKNSLEDLKKRLDALEKKVKTLESKLKEVKQKPLPKKSNDPSKKSAPKVAKFESLVNADFTVTSPKGEKISLDQEFIVSNTVLPGDTLFVEYKNGSYVFKVARRCKKSFLEALTTEKKDGLYAVSTTGVYKLFSLDVKSKGVLKGFEVNLVLPKGKESSIDKALIQEVLFAGPNPDNEIESSQNPQDADASSSKEEDFNPRVLEEDDLI